MFRKPFKIKSCSNLKSSDKKRFHSTIKSVFSLSDEDVTHLFPSKDPISCHRLINASKDIVMVYGCQNRPLFFEIGETVYPTIFALWISPNVIPCIPVHELLVEKFMNGADLMIPGVANSSQFDKEIKEGSLVYLCTLENKSAIAVGKTTVSSKEMVYGNKGKAVHIYHTINDELSKLFDIKDSIPNLGPLLSSISPTFSSQSCPSDQRISGLSPEDTETNITVETSIINPSEEELFILTPDMSNETKLRETNQDMSMDELIMFCFLKALKTSASKIKLPVLTNIFYKNHMLEAVPKGSSIDIKKSKYKKLSLFLSEVAENGLIEVETTKGVQSITHIHYEHEMIRNFKVEKLSISESTSLPKLQVEEKYVINGAVCPVFSKFNLKKGDHLSDQEIRLHVTNYVKAGNLVERDQFIRLDDVLQRILASKETIVSWKELFDGIKKKMGLSYSVKTPCNNTITGKGKLPFIKLSTVTKAANKKVTLVDNLDAYGININDFSKECQLGVAASATINTLPSSKGAQFQIQGNQKIFITRLLTEKYCIPKKYIEGCEEQKKKDGVPKPK